MTDSAAEMDSVVPENSLPVRSPFLWVFRTGLLALTLLAVLFGAAWAWFGTFDAAHRFLRGDMLDIRPAQIDLGTVPVAREIEKSVSIRNLTLHSVVLTGARGSCNCITTNEFPVTIRSGEAHDVSVRLRTPSHPESIRYHITVYTNVPGREQIVLPLTGEARASATTVSTAVP